MLSKEEIDKRLEQTEDDEITINLLYQKVNLLEDLINEYEVNMNCGRENQNTLRETIKTLQKDKQKLIEKLEEDIKKFSNYEERKQMCKEQLFENDGKWFYAQEILKILKGEQE